MDDRSLFRGKRVADGNWVKGAYIYVPCAQHEHYVIPRPRVRDTYFRFDSNVAVQGETVGQCTGLKDKNGKLVFEGDKLFHEDMLGYAKCEGDERFAVVRWDGNFDARFIGDMRTTCYNILSSKFKDCEIIGNIHDNAELLEEDLK